MNTATALPTFDFKFFPRQTGKDKFFLCNVPMPASGDLKKDERNGLKLCVRYMKDGMHRQGRGIYLTVTGHATDGVYERHMLMSDPSEYILIEPAKRLSAKRLAEVVDAVTSGTILQDTLNEQVARARAYYESKGR